jgi:hypothetical protein
VEIPFHFLISSWRGAEARAYLYLPWDRVFDEVRIASGNACLELSAVVRFEVLDEETVARYRL